MTHRQKMKELLPIIQAYCDGAEVERQSLHNKGEWVLDGDPQFMCGLNYRIKQTPDTGKPNKDISSWIAAAYIQPLPIQEIRYGTVSWENSLVERPEGV